MTAAGASTRMGSPKALVPFSEGGAPPRALLRHQLETIASSAHISETVVVLGSSSELIRRSAAGWGLDARVHLVDNPHWEEGRSTSLEAGAAAVAHLGDVDAVLIAAVDQPLIVSIFETLISIFETSFRDAEVLIPTCDGRRGHPILLSGELLPGLCQVSRFPEGLRGLVRSARIREVEVGDARIFRDLNTPKDLA